MRFAALCALAAVSAAGAAAATPEALHPSSLRSLGGDRWEDLFVPEAATTQLRLSRQGLLWGSERVYRDGRLLQAGRDYACEPAAGLIRLTVPAGESVLQVIYLAPPVLQPSRSLAGVPSAPPSNLTGRLQAALRTSLPGTQGTGPAPSSGPPALRDELLSGLRLTQHAEQLSGAGADRGAVSYFRADPLDPATAIAGREEFSSNLDLRTSRTSRLRLLNTFAQESLFTDAYERQERQRVHFEQTLGKSTAGLLWERRRSDGRGVANALDALSLSLAHPFSRNTTAEGYFSLEESLYRGRETESLVSLKQRLGQVLSAQAGLQYRTSEYNGSTLETGLTLVAQPARASDVTLALRQADSEKYGRYQRLSADINAALSRRVQVVAELSRRSSEQFGSIDTFGLGLAARPTTITHLEAAFSQSVGEALGQQQTQTLRFGLDPSAAFKLQLGYDRTFGSREGVSQNGLWILTLGGERYFKVEGYAAAHQPKDTTPYLDQLHRVEFRPLEPLALSAQLRRVLLDEEDRAVAGVGANLRLLRHLEVSAGYRKPAVDGHLVQDLDGRDVRLSLTPVSRLRLFGQYSVRPEDERGGLLDQVHRSLGLETSLGSLSLQGMVTRMEGRLVTEPGQRLDLLAALQLGSSTRLYGGFRTQDPLALDQQRSRIYRLGVSQSAGTAFLMLEGQLGWTLDAAGNRTWSAEDALAQARIGLRF